MYKCNDCSREFENPKVEKEIIGTDNQTGIIDYEYCPYCDSSSIKLKELKCSNCGSLIINNYYRVLDNILQKKYFDSEDENCFCSKDCFCDYVMLEEASLDDDE